MFRSHLTLTLILFLVTLPAFHGGPLAAQIQKDDLVIGLSISSTDSFRIVRPKPGAIPGVTPDGGEVGMATPWVRDFIEGAVFDHANDIHYNASGNFLGTNFGGGDTGFEVLNFATDGSGNFESLWSIKAETELVTRGAGLSVSLDNTKLAWGGHDGKIHVLSYNAGSTPGTGNGASVDGWIETAGGDTTGGQEVLIL